MMRFQTFDNRGAYMANGAVWIYAFDDAFRRECQEVVGCVNVVRKHEPTGRIVVESERDETSSWWINDLFVQESYRRRGVGRQLVNKAVCTAIEFCEYCQTVACGIGINNLASRALFESCGFRFVYRYPEGGILLYAKGRDE